jgi:polysaccharide export outer membrane protein
MSRGILGVLLALFSLTPAWAQEDAKNRQVAPPDPIPQTSDQDPSRHGTSPGSSSDPSRGNTRYRLRPGDVLDLTFLLTPEFNQTLTVQADGYITPRGLGGLRAEGRTIPELVQLLEAGYKGILHQPVITVDLKDFEKPYFVVNGQVEHPGKFDLRGNTTVAEAIALAGGFKENAKHSQVLLFRRISDQWAEVKTINLKQMLNAKNLSEDARLHPGDLLFVPKNAISKYKQFIPVPGLGAYASLH